MTRLSRTGGPPCLPARPIASEPLAVNDLYSFVAVVFSEIQLLQHDPDFPGFFAHQVVNNACATLAAMNATANIPGLQMGVQLSEHFTLTEGMDPQEKFNHLRMDTPARLRAQR